MEAIEVMIRISQPFIGDDEINAVVEVMRSGMLVQGEKVRRLEEEFTRSFSQAYAVALNSGTAAIHAALYSIGIKEDDEVVTTPFTFVGSVNPVLMLGARPVFVDICEDDFNIDPAKAEEKITERTRAIIPVDLYGQTYRYERTEDIANKYGLKVVEDACQAVGAECEGRKAGTLGDAGIFSFYATKNIMCGEGGMLLTDDESISQKSRVLRDQGQSGKERFDYLDMGYNYRMTDIAAAILLEQLKRLDDLNSKRMRNATLLAEGLADIEGMRLPVTRSGCKHVFNQFTVRLTGRFKGSRSDLMDYLHKNGIQTGIYYPRPLHLYEHLTAYGYSKGDFPVAEKVAMQVLSLPVHAMIEDRDIQYMIEKIREYVR